MEISQILERPVDLTPTQVEKLSGVSLKLSELLAKVESAKTNNEKKLSLEQLGAAVFDIQPFINCKYKNLRTASNEIDIVCENLGNSRRTFLDEYGRYFLVECKNWSKPVGAKEIRDFKGKLEITKTKLGVFFSSLGITGEAKGTDAFRVIRNLYDSGGPCIVVVTNSDLRSTKELSDVIAIIDEKLDALRFDL